MIIESLYQTQTLRTAETPAHRTVLICHGCVPCFTCYTQSLNSLANSMAVFCFLFFFLFIYKTVFCQQTWTYPTDMTQFLFALRRLQKAFRVKQSSSPPTIYKKKHNRCKLYWIRNISPFKSLPSYILWYSCELCSFSICEEGRTDGEG